MARFVWIVIGYFLFTTAYAAAETEESDLKQVTRIAKAFAESHILGTGATQYLTRVRDVSGNNATVFLGQSDETGNDPEVYKANLKKIGGKWKVATYEFGKIGTTGDLKRIVRRVDMHGSLYPSLELDQLVESNGGSGYYKQFPNELDKDEAPILLLRRSRFITIDIINKHKTEGVVIGRIQRGKQAETFIDVYGRTENDVSQYLQDISAELPLVAVVDVSALDACGKSIVKAKLSITANQEQLTVPENQDITKISFEIEGKSFDCTLKEVASSRAKNEDIVSIQQVQQPATNPIYSAIPLITVEKLEALKPDGFYIGSVKANSQGASVVAYSTSSANIAKYLRQLADVSQGITLAEVRVATDLEAKSAAQCGSRLTRAVISVRGDNKQLVELNPDGKLILIAPETGNTNSKCEVHIN